MKFSQKSKTSARALRKFTGSLAFIASVVKALKPFIDLIYAELAHSQGDGGFRAFKPMLLQARWLQGQQTYFATGAVASEPTNLCWYRCGGSKASKLVLIQARWLQGQQTCVGAYGRSFQFETIWFEDAKLAFQVAYQISIHHC